MMHNLLHKTCALAALAALVACTLVLGAAPAGASENAVILRPAAVVEDEVVRLADLFDGIADPALAQTPVARAPEPGVSVEIGARWLYAVAEAHALPWQPRSAYERITLKRASRDVPTAVIEAALRAALAEQGVAGDVQLVLDNPDLRLTLPSDSAGGLRIARLTLDPSNGRFLAQAVAPASGEPQERLSITGRALALTEVPVLKSGLKPGEIIRERDIEWISLPANRLTRTTVVDSAALIGMTPRRPIRAQDVIRTTDLEMPVMVAKNSLVTIRLQTERMQLTVQGRALDDGAEGDVVRVMNTQSNNVVSAVVVASGAVEVVPARITAQR
jgi:flagella basal body P-ring formation protein FlgA